MTARPAPSSADQPTSMDQHSTVHLRITGLVQGVGFRESMCAVADALRVNGWVRNCRDGSVEAMLQGAQQDVERLLEWSHNGPPGASVRFVDVQVAQTEEHFSAFERRATC